MKEKARLQPGENTIRFLLCLLTAAAMWLILALNDSYDYHTNLLVQIDTPPGQGAINHINESVQLKVRASGWNLLRLHTQSPQLGFSYHQIQDRSVIDLKSELSAIERLFPEELKVMDVYPSFIPLNWVQKASKMIPVHLQFSEVPGFQVVMDSISIVPDSILITTSQLNAEQISDWSTELIQVRAESGYQAGTVALKKPSGETLSAIVVHYRIFLEKDTLQN